MNTVNQYHHHTAISTSSSRPKKEHAKECKPTEHNFFVAIKSNSIFLPQRLVLVCSKCASFKVVEVHIE